VAGERSLLDRVKARLQEHAEETGGSPESDSRAGESTELAEALAELKKKNQALKRARRRIAEKQQELDMLRASLVEQHGDQAGGIRPENMVWIFGAGRTGSSWLAAMIEEMKGQTVWFEPRVGDVFNTSRFERFRGRNFILSVHYRKTWLRSIRNFVLDGANARFPEARGPDKYLMIKDPAGSVGAPLLMEVFSESRMVLLVRDPRDVAASWLDAARQGGWQNERRKKDRRDRRSQEAQADTNPNAAVRRHAEAYLRNVGKAKEAFDSHRGHKVLVRYEDLRANTLAEMKRLYATLEIPVQEKELARAVHKHSWENIPEEKKGEGKFYRKATPGGWQEDLTPKQAQIVERITAPLLREFYPENGL
jgi:hypothetical protein